MNTLSVTDLENFANGNSVGVQNFKNSNTNMENLTPAEQNLIKANLQFTTFFLDTDLEGEQFTFTVSNASTTAKTVLLYRGDNTFIENFFLGGASAPNLFIGFPSMATTTGHPTDATSSAWVSVSSGTPNVSVEHMMKYLATKNTEITRIRATFSDVQQVSQTLILKRINPVKTLRDEFFQFADDRLKGVSDQTTFDINKAFLFTPDNALIVTLLPGSQLNPNRVTFTFYFGLQMKDSTMFSRVLELYKSAARRVAPAGVLNEVASDVATLNNSPVALLL